jgi:hypothetical protein
VITWQVVVFVVLMLAVCALFVIYWPGRSRNRRDTDQRGGAT